MITKLKRLFGVRAGKQTMGPLTDDRIAAFLAGPANSSALAEAVTPETALSLSDYYAAIRNISEDVAKLPFKVYRQLKPRGKRSLPRHPVYRLLHTVPNPEMTPIAFRETLTHWAIGWGNGFAEIERNNAGTPIALWPIHPNRVSLVREGGKLFAEIRMDNTGSIVLPYSDMLHIKGLGNGYLGYSVVQLAAESIGHGQALERFGAAFFGNGATIGTVFTFPHALSPKAREDFRDMLRDQREGLANAHRSLIMEHGGKPERSSIPNNEAQFIESRQLSVEVMCRWLRIPPHKVQHLLRATFTNIESQAREYVTDTLMPWMIRWEQEANRKLLSPNASGLFTEHTVNALLRGESDKRAAFFSTMYQIGAFTTNEIRDLEGMNPVEGGNVPMVQGALIPMTEAQKPKAQPITKAIRGKPSDAESIAAIALAYVPLIRSALAGCNRTAVGKYETGNWTPKATTIIGPTIESMATAIAVVRGTAPLTVGFVRPVVESVIAHYLESGCHQDRTGAAGADWLGAESELLAELAAGAVWTALDAEMN